MPACDASYDVMLTDDSFAVWWSTITDHDRITACLDFLEERLPDDFGDPGQLIAALFVRGRNRRGQKITQPFRKRFQIDDKGKLHRVYAHHRRYLRWHIPDEDPSPHDDPDWILPP